MAIVVALLLHSYKPFPLHLKQFLGDLKGQQPSPLHFFVFSPFESQILKTRTFKNNCIYGEDLKVAMHA